MVQIMLIHFKQMFVSTKEVGNIPNALPTSRNHF